MPPPPAQGVDEEVLEHDPAGAPRLWRAEEFPLPGSVSANPTLRRLNCGLPGPRRPDWASLISSSRTRGSRTSTCSCAPHPYGGISYRRSRRLRKERRARDDRPAGGLASLSRLSVRPTPNESLRSPERWESGLPFRGTQAASGCLQDALTFELAGRRTHQPYERSSPVASETPQKGPHAVPPQARRRFREVCSPDVRGGPADPLGQRELHGQVRSVWPAVTGRRVAAIGPGGRVRPRASAFAAGQGVAQKR